MALLIALVLGWASFWTLYAVSVWLFGRERDWWHLVLLFAGHWLLYWLVEAEGLGSSGAAAAGWFLLGPTLGGLWLTFRAAWRGPGRDALRLRPARTVLLVSTTGLLDFLVTTGAAVPLLAGAVYVIARFARVVP